MLRIQMLNPKDEEESHMRYKTMVLQLLQDRPKLHERLCQDRMLMPEMERYASELKASHQAWMRELALARPDSVESQIASEALELAMEELQNRLPPESEDETETFSPDEAMAYITRRMPTV
jgi:hypothetical protein